MTPSQLLLQAADNIIDGMEWTLDGVHGKLCVVIINGMTEYEHHASKKGKNSEEYQSHRRKLGDDYVSTILLDSPEMEKIFEVVSKIMAKNA